MDDFRFFDLTGEAKDMASKRLSFVVLALFATATVSCTSLPDTSSYTAASFQLKNSAAAAGAVLQSELGRMSEQLPENQRARAKDLGTRFDAAWQTTVGSLDGLGRYAESIEEITKAGNSGGESARGLAQSISNLAGAIGIVPGTQLAGVATDTFAMLYTQIANIRAARSLERSLDMADPLIRDMTNVIVGQVATARKSFDDIIDLERQALEFSVQDIAQLDARLQAADNEAATTVAALAADGARESERAAAEADLKRIRDGRAALEPRMKAYHAERAALAERAQAGRDLFAATDRAVANWRDSHQKVATAIRERRPVSVQSVAASAEEIRALIERWRQL
jgi:hypothetical protein